MDNGFLLPVPLVLHQCGTMFRQVLLWGLGWESSQPKQEQFPLLWFCSRTSCFSCHLVTSFKNTNTRLSQKKWCSRKTHLLDIMTDMKANTGWDFPDLKDRSKTVSWFSNVPSMWNILKFLYTSVDYTILIPRGTTTVPNIIAYLFDFLRYKRPPWL